MIGGLTASSSIYLAKNRIEKYQKYNRDEETLWAPCPVLEGFQVVSKRCTGVAVR